MRRGIWLLAQCSVPEVDDDSPPGEGKRDVLQKAKKEAAEHQACVRSVLNCKSPAKACSQSEAAENAVAASKSNVQQLDSFTQREEKPFPTPSVLQSPRK